MMRASVPVFISRGATVFLGNVETPLVAIMTNPTLAAVYGLTDRIFQIGQQMINPIGGSVFNGIAHLVGEGGEAKVRTVLGEIFCLWAAITAIVLPPPSA